jgi:hypothetical protein
MTLPRGDVIVRRFLAGESIEAIALWLWQRYGLLTLQAIKYIEGCIRWALNRKRARR